ncbi:MAG: primosomal protein N' [Gammaproteobacteria bacterium]|nr:primosomal protein N' [Gammaproteobacteria bacterium]MBU0772210.1 primosomal protein N' [Gammaproteobacteria bacterium]MBU0855273.1 primosomal protein N' [Gammaproteobacteria bacterium]MBU1848337.1 primosomal protein N' [Gammaproteobacteria bacterium]
MGSTAAFSPQRLLRVALARPIPTLFDYDASGHPDVEPGMRVRVPFGRGELWGIAWAWCDAGALDPARIKSLLAVDRAAPALPAGWRALVEFVAHYYQQPIGEVAAMAAPPAISATRASRASRRFRATDAGRAALDALPARDVGRKLIAALVEAGSLNEGELRALSSRAGVVLERLVSAGQIEIALPEAPAEAAHVPGADQQAALDALLADDGFAVSLLHGVTGSGKTEVYLRLIDAQIAAGRQSLLLVPEIALTPQLQARVAARFPRACLHVMHSEMSDGARAMAWAAAQSGEADILLGTRLAVFAPLPRLGCIVLDEEHDASFRQTEGVRYSARDVAVWRARNEDVPIVLGSATPSLESLRHAIDGRYRWLRLTTRAGDASLPAVHLIDTRVFRANEGLSQPMGKAIEQRLERGEQTLLFINRRGYAPVLSCPACGWAAGCTQCTANLVLHAADRRLRCHHCGAEGPVPHACPKCGNQDIQGYGRGTQRLEETLASRFPQARLLRIDRDNVRGRGHWQQQLDLIRHGEVDLVVGTQLLAKGHDFPGITLVGVIGADASLHAADFRAQERLFAQLMQVGGRAGRAGTAGEVLIQTAQPEHPLFAALRAHDFDGFARSQLEERALLGLPPHGFQILLSADAPELPPALDFLAAARRAAQALEIDGVQIYDAVPMRMVRRAGRERAQLVVESRSRPQLRALLLPWVANLYRLRVARGLRWHIDVDPLEV